MTTNELKQQIAAAIVERLELEDHDAATFPMDAILFGPAEHGGLELDSIASLEIIAVLSDKYDLPFDDITRDEMMSVDSISEYIERKFAARDAGDTK